MIIDINYLKVFECTQNILFCCNFSLLESIEFIVIIVATFRLILMSCCYYLLCKYISTTCQQSDFDK